MKLQKLRNLVEQFTKSDQWKDWCSQREKDIRFELNHLELHDLDDYLLTAYNQGYKFEGNPNSSNIAYLIGLTDTEPTGCIKSEGGAFPD